MTADDELVQSILRAAQSFRDDLRSKGLHVGIGSPPVCCTCDEPWPCSHERNESDDA